RGSSCSLPCWVLSPGPDRTWLGLEGGMLCQLIRSPDYNLFPNSAVFESNFIQVAGENQGVTKKGKWMDITHTPTIVTLAVTSSDPCLPLPNVLLMANQQAPLQRSLTASVALPRLLPLRYVRLSVHSASQRILRLQTVTKTVYYLQLHHKYPEAVFALWSRLTNILENGLSTTTKDPAIPIRHCLVSSRSSSTSRALENRLSPSSSLWQPLKYWKAAAMSPLVLLSSPLARPKSCNCSSYPKGAFLCFSQEATGLSGFSLKTFRFSSKELLSG
uniref:Golgi associated RAB2 interactor 1A n=1 Tax=Naja naja TaxID=35670 RepID=A0A8C6YJN5_NAJNA